MTNLIVDIKEMSHPQNQKTYEGNLIENINFSCEGGEIISILGPSGAGKTTLLRIIAGLEKNYTGYIKLDNVDIKEANRKIQVVFQDNKLFPWLTVSENLEFVQKKTKNSIISDLLNKLNINKKQQNDYIKNLSGGEEARVSLGRTFVDVPKVLLLDEPFMNLDVKTKKQIIEEVLTFHKDNPETIIIMVSHSIDDCIAISSKLYVYSAKPMKLVGSPFDNNDESKIPERKKEIEELILSTVE